MSQRPKNFATYTFPPNQLYIDNGTILRVTVFAYSSGAPQIRVTGQMLRWPDNEVVNFQTLFTPTVALAANVVDIPITAGFLMSCAVTVVPDSTNRRNQIFAKVEQFYGSQYICTIIQGYVRNNISLSYPGTGLTDPSSGKGYFRLIVGTNTVSPGVNSSLRINSIICQVTTDATVGDRYLNLTTQNVGNNNEIQWFVPQAMTASKTYYIQLHYPGNNQMSFFPGIPGFAGGAEVIQGTIPEFYLDYNVAPFIPNFSMSLLNPGAGDAIAGQIITVEQWVNPV